jgi:uncharacterized protein DUF4337
MSEELHELHEHAEHAREHPDLAPVTITMAVLAVLVAIVSLLGHRTHTEEIISKNEEVLLQNKVTDQWAYYQAKNIRRHNDELFADLTTLVATKDAQAAAALKEKYQAEADRYKDEQKELDAKARELENDGKVTRQEGGLISRKADRFDLGEVFLEIALVITSITLLSGRRIYWHMGLFMAAAGILVACSAWLLH